MGKTRGRYLNGSQSEQRKKCKIGSKEIQKIIEMSKSHGIPGKAPKLLNNLAGDASNSEANKGNNNSKLRKP